MSMSTQAERESVSMEYALANQLLDGRDQAGDVGGRAEAVVAAFDERRDHLGCLEALGDLQRILPRYVGVLSSTR